MAQLYYKQGQYDDDEGLLLEALEGQNRLLGADHPDTLSSVYGLNTLYIAQGRFDEAERSLHIGATKEFVGGGT